MNLRENEKSHSHGTGKRQDRANVPEGRFPSFLDYKVMGVGGKCTLM